METETIEVSNRTSNNSLKTIIAIVIVIVVGIWLFGVLRDVLRPKSWTLFLYSSENPDMNYLLNRVDNLSSKDICTATGFAYTKKFGSYECGYDCKFNNKYFTEICDKTCDHGGCRD